MAIGVGVPGIKSERSRQMVRETLANAKLVTVRDSGSFDELNEFEELDVIKTACPAFSLRTPEDAKNRGTGINFRPWFEYDRSDFLDYFGYSSNLRVERAHREYIDNAKTIISRVDDPIFIPFHWKDQRFAERHFDIPVLKYTPSVEETLNRVGNVQQMVTTRYHSLIFASITGKPVFAITYSPKMRELTTDLNVPAIEPHGDDPEPRFGIPENVDEKREEALRNWDLIQDKLDLCEGGSVSTSLYE